MSERLHKVLAQHGLGSRREVERWIAEGRITLNGQIAKTGDAYNDGDRVQLDGRDVTKRISRVAAAQVLAYHKPQGQAIKDQSAASNEHEAEPITGETVLDRLPVQRGSRWLPINPMHAGDSGLLLLTNDGALSYALTRQKKWIPTSYLVRVHVRGGLAHAPTLPTTLQLDQEKIEFTKVEAVGDPLEQDTESGNVWYQVDLARADKRAAVRALFVSHDLIISRMMQVAFGPISLTKEMPRSRHVALKPAQLEQLYALAKLPVPAVPGVLKRKAVKKPTNRDSEHDVSPPARAKVRHSQTAVKPHAPGKRAMGKLAMGKQAMSKKAAVKRSGDRKPDRVGGVKRRAR